MQEYNEREGYQPSTIKAWIGLGGNLGHVEETIRAALQVLQHSPHIKNMQVSSFYRSAPIDAEGDDFINAVACFQTTLAPLPLLHLLQAVEQQFGRERPFWHAPRTLDLDLLLYGDVVMRSPELTLPHPAIHERAFVLQPMAELDAMLIIPHQGALKDLLEGVQGQVIRRLDRG